MNNMIDTYTVKYRVENNPNCAEGVVLFTHKLNDTLEIVQDCLEKDCRQVTVIAKTMSVDKYIQLNRNNLTTTDIKYLRMGL